MAAGSVIVYAAGVPWLKIAFSLSWGKAVAAGMVPFLPGDVLKIAAGTVIAGKIRHFVKI